MDALSLASVTEEEERDKRLFEAGNQLLQQPLSSKEELLEKLDNLEHLLSTVKQAPPASVRDAFRPAMEALVADGLLRHPDIDVKVSVASCISEITRITAPDEPYEDSILKDFFELAVLAIGKLSCLDGRCYSKVVSIIEVLAKCKTCVLMWDLELDALVVQMFQHFLNSIRPDHPDQVFMNIVEIMSLIIKESEEIPMQLLNILISSVKKENQNVSPCSYVLGEKVLQKSAVELHQYLPKAVRSLGISMDNYSEVVELICSEAIKSKTTGESDQFVNGASKSQVENFPEEPCHEETSKCLPDTDCKVAASNSSVVISVRPVDDSFKTPVNIDSKELSHNATSDGKVGPSFLGSKSPTNDNSGELAPHATPERVTPFLDQPPNLLGKDDPKSKDDDVILETDTTLKESERGDAMKQQKSTVSRTTSRPENLGFMNAAKKELDPEATQASKKRDWKPKFLNKPEEGYDDAWIRGERRSKGRILLKGRGKDNKKMSSYSPKCAISNGLYFSSGEEKTPIMTSITRIQKEKNDKTGQNDGAQFSARDAPGARTKKKISQPTLVASEEFAVVEEIEEKHEKDEKKIVPSRYRDKRCWSSVDESGAEALGYVSNTKESNFPETSKEQRKRKNSPSQEEAWGSVSIIKKSNFHKTSKKQRKRKNSLSQDEDSADKVVTKHGEELVGCRVRVWWPLDQVFYDGHITLFDHSEKKHLVIYEDGDEEMLNLTTEHWELIDNENASDPIQETVPGPTDLSDVRLDCNIDSYRHIRKKKKGKAVDDSTTPTITHNLTPNRVHQNKGIKVEGSESSVEGNPMSWTTPIKVSPEDDDVCSELVDVHGYKVKVSSAPILAAIFVKYGDITVNCHQKSPTARASLLDVVSDVVRRLKTSDVSFSSIKAMKSVVSNAADAKLDVTWLQQYLDEISEEEDMEKKSSYLMALSETTMLVSKAAKKDLVEMNREVLAAEKRLKTAERLLREAQSRAGEAKRSVKVFKILGEKVQQDIKQAKDQAEYWQSRLNELL